MLKTILSRLAAFLRSLRCIFYSNAELRFENMVLHQQLATFKKEKTRPKLSRFDRIFWVFLRRLWRKWEDVLFIVKPETVVNWHKKGFKLYWDFISNRRKKKEQNNSWREARALVRKMAVDNETWGAPRIHGELLKLGFKLSERTVSRYMPKKKPSGDNIK
ncbi:MAG: integrase, partial [Desulfobacteraceae bacterium]|nr:integrase [Desulfobacteraceae bacterium]